jgi:hypothetical protein
MTPAVVIERVAAASPRLKARIAGVFYLLTFLTGTWALVFASGRPVAIFLASCSYVAVTLLFYDIFRPVSRNLSLLAALVSLVGCVTGAVSPRINPLVFFGFYCLLIGYLIFRSSFLPRMLGVLMAFGGLAWLTFLSRTLAHDIYPYNLAPGLFGEGALTLWLLGALDRTRRPAAGCDQQRLPKAIGPASASVSGTVAS